MSNVIENDIYETGEPICDLTIKLAEDVRIQRRVYTKFVTILGDVGGFMEVIFTLFRIVSSFSVDILYEISLVNHLFKFNPKKKEILLRINEGDGSSIDFKEKEVEVVNSKNNYTRKKTKGLTVKQSIYNIKYNNDKNSLNLSSSKSKTNLPDIEIESNRAIFGKNKLGISQNKKLEKNININNTNNQNNNKGQQNNKNYLNKVRLNRACVYLWFCFVRRRNILDNILLDEGMDFISKRLDIFNIFEKVYKAEIRNEKLNNKIISMSDECKTRLKLFESKINEKDII